MESSLLFQKVVDKSLISEGFSIPQLYHPFFYEQIGAQLKHGESIVINVILENEIYQVQLKNQNFDLNKYPGHKDVLQVRYAKNSPLSIKLREIFSKTDKTVEDFYATKVDKRNLIIPKVNQEFLAIYSTPEKGTLLFDCITSSEVINEVKEIKSADEFALELAIDTGAGIIERTQTRKIRKLSHAIGNNLKKIYGYRCQICGEYIGEPYGSNLIHAHHIDYFTKSLNNDADNILIVCPNHHGIIHDRNPQFDRKAKVFEYPNGYREGLKLNKHL